MKVFAGHKKTPAPQIYIADRPPKADMGKKKRDLAEAATKASAGSPNPKLDMKGRRVSFNSVVERSDGQFDDSLDVSGTANRTPTRSILKRKYDSLNPNVGNQPKKQKSMEQSKTISSSSEKRRPPKLLNEPSMAADIGTVSFDKKDKKQKTKQPKKVKPGKPGSAAKLKKKKAKLEEKKAKKLAEDEKDETEDGMKKKKKIKLQITREMKEKLKTMPRHEKKKYLRELRAKQKPLYEIAKQAKRLWEKVRSGKTNSKEREEKIEELCGLVKGKAKQLIYGHDTVRVIQYLMSLDNKEVRAWLFDELVSDVIKMAKSKYAKFFIIKMLKYGTPEQRALVMRACSGKITDLMRNNFACDVVECAYNQHANALQRWHIITEFYGKQASLMWSDSEPCPLTKMLNDQPNIKAIVLNNIKDNLIALADKPAFRHSICHKLLIDYLESCDDNERKEMCAVFLDKVPQILHTRDGAHASMHAVWHSNAKERKTLLKNLKGLIGKTCLEEHGSLVLMALADCVDDTVMMKKTVIQEMIGSLPELMKSKHGLRIVDHMLRPRDGRYLQKEQRQLLARGDNNAESKKDAAVRWRELRVPLLPAVLDYVAENMNNMLLGEDKHLAVFVLNALETTQETATSEDEKSVDDKRQKCFDVIAELCAIEFIPANFEGQLHCVEHPRSHFVIARLLKSDKYLVEAGRPTLTGTVIGRLSVDEMTHWTACNKGCFVLLNMIESGDKESVVLRNALKAYHDKLQQQSHAGATALLKCLTNSS